MRRLSNSATIFYFLLLFCCFFNGNCYGMKRDVSVIGLIHKRSWCPSVEDGFKQDLVIDLENEGIISGVASRRDDTVTAFTLSYRKNNDGSWSFYKEDGIVKIFRANKKPKGRFIRHWLRHKIAARYVKFRATKWKRPLCLHIEIYGWGERKIRTDFRRRNNGRSSPIFQELSMGQKGRKDDEKLEKDSKNWHSMPDRPTPYTQEEKKSNMKLTITVCFLATGIIAILALIIICKWEQHERKIRPDYLRANLRDNLKTNLRGTKPK